MPRRLALVPTLACAAAGFAADSVPAAAPEAPRALPSSASLAGAGDGAERLLRNIRWGAYGELHYNNFQSDATAQKDRIELHRLVLLAEAQLHERIGFVAEIEIEHGFVQAGQGEVEVEQAYLDFLLHERHHARAGVLLVPISIGNLYHEPTLFHGTERPYIDNLIVPTTWYEAGAGLYGNILEGLDYAVVGQAGLDSTNLDGQRFQATNAIRGGRQRGFESDAENFMGTARLDYRPLAGLWLAGAVNAGDSTHDESIEGGQVILYTLEARYNAHAIDAGVTWAQGRISDPETLPLYSPTTNPIPEVFEGLSAFVAYDVLSFVGDTAQQLYPFVRYENIDTQAEVPDGATVNEALQRQIIQYGLTYKPIPQVAIKFDYRDESNDSDTTAVDSWNVGVGFAF
ncbi:MAG TPA: hypothetical protein VEL07_19765 [Planctomycetota bacterium]|nr:hypothetical protein [Planctomycetota bacterium]